MKYLVAEKSAHNAEMISGNRDCSKRFARETRKQHFKAYKLWNMKLKNFYYTRSERVVI